MITAIYIPLLVLLFIVLSIRTLRIRHRLQIAVGTQGSDELLRATRVHGNFAEYVPISLLLCFLLEYYQADPFLVHFCCLALVVGRYLHAYGVSQAVENYRYRVTGMALTFLCLLLGSVGLVFIVLEGEASLLRSNG